jgi:hypothetical protein
MKRALPLAFAFAATLGIAGPAKGEQPRLATGMRVVVVGEITSPPKGELEEKKMQVGIGPRKRDYTLHFSHAQLTGLSGERIDEDGFHDGQWVRAEGTVMDDPRRIQVDRVQIVAPDRGAYAVSRHFYTGYSFGYVLPFQRATLATSLPQPQGARVVVVGEITSQPKLGESKMQVGIGPARTDYTLHMADAPLFGLAGERVEENDLTDRMWVRAEGTIMDDPRRIRVDRLQVIAPDRPTYVSTVFFRPGWDYGYVSSGAGSRQTLSVVETRLVPQSQMVLVARVTDDTGTFQDTRRLRVKAGDSHWTLHVPREALAVTARSEKISVHEIHQGQWVRAIGWETEPGRLRVHRMENIGPEEAYRSSAIFRLDAPLGYIERPAHSLTTMFTGTVVAVNRDAGYVTARDATGAERRIYLDMPIIDSAGRPLEVTQVKTGDLLTVTGRVRR